MQGTVQVLQRKKDSILHFAERKKSVTGFMSNRFAGYSYQTHYRCHYCGIWMDKLDPDLESYIRRNHLGTMFHRPCGKRLRSNPHAWKRNAPRTRVYID